MEGNGLVVLWSLGCLTGCKTILVFQRVSYTSWALVSEQEAWAFLDQLCNAELESHSTVSPCCCVTALSLHVPGYFPNPVALCAWKTPRTVSTSTILVVTGYCPALFPGKDWDRKQQSLEREERAGPACPEDWSSVGREEAVPASLLFTMWVGKSCCCLAEDEFLLCFSQVRFDSWAGSWALVCVVCRVPLQEKGGWSNLEWIFSFKYISQMDMWQGAPTVNSLYVQGNREERRNRADRKSGTQKIGVHTGIYIRNTFPKWLKPFKS